MIKILQQLDHVIKHQKLIASGERILVCVSGGCDSVALLHLLFALQRKWNYELHVLHFNHQLRPEAQQEEHFVRKLAQKYQLPFYLKTTEHLAPLNSGIQEHARNWRLQESQMLLEEIHGHRIATAHHADDQAETFLLKFLRGTHLSHLQGMSWKSAVFIRPLLNFKKQELQEYLSTRKLDWREDSSNQKTHYLRNRVRLELIPLMQELSRGALTSHISNMSEQSQQLQSWLDVCTEEVEGSQEILKDCFDASLLQSQPEFLQHSLLHQFIQKHTGLSINYDIISHLLEMNQQSPSSWKWQLSAQWQLSQHKNTITILSTL